MAGVLPARAEMTDRIQALGYVDGDCTGGPRYMPGGSHITGHEFHYSKVICRPEARFCMKLRRGAGISGGLDGLHEHEVCGCYTHTMFQKSFAERLVGMAERYQRS